MTNKNTLNPKLIEILTLLYRFRFLTREQIQKMLGHKYHSRILSWLTELVELKYIAKFYDRSVIGEPAKYYLDTEGRKYLKKVQGISLEPLSRVWREKNYSKQFRTHCLFVADIYLSLNDNNMLQKFSTKTDLYGVANLISPLPDAYFIIEDRRYFLDIFDDIAPIYLRKRIKEHFQYFNSDEWQDNTDKPFPDIVLVCPNTRIKNHLYFYIQNKIDEDSEISFYLTTWEAIKQKGLTKEVLEKVKPKD
jgi:hypothetical protein